MRPGSEPISACLFLIGAEVCDGERNLCFVLPSKSFGERKRHRRRILPFRHIQPPGSPREVGGLTVPDGSHQGAGRAVSRRLLGP